MADLAPPAQPSPQTPPACSPQPAAPANAVNPNKGWKHYLASVKPQANLK